MEGEVEVRGWLRAGRVKENDACGKRLEPNQERTQETTEACFTERNSLSESLGE